MGCWQRRIGPLNLGLIGMLSAFVNGFNLIISHIIVPNLHFNFGFFLFPFFYFVFSFFNYFLLFPFFIFGLYFSLFLFIFLSSLSFIFILFSAFGGCSKFCILGCVRMISQLISFELIFGIYYYFFVWSYINLRVFSYL